MNITKVTKLVGNPVQTPTSVSVEPVKEESKEPEVQVSVAVEETKAPGLISFDYDSVMRGIIMATILGTPKGRLPRRGL